jgi:amino acid adenylation domain-containing protein
MQENVWLLEQLNPGSGFFNMPLVLRLEGPLEVGAMRSALEAVVERYDALRTTIGLEDGVPAQRVHERLPRSIAETDLSATSAELRRARALEIAADEARRPFDLANEPLIRVHVIRLEPTSWILAVIIHHIVCDGWSLRLIGRELAAQYGVRVNGGALGPRRPVRSFGALADEARARIEGGGLDREEAYWRTQLEGARLELALPFDHTPPLARTYAGASIVKGLGVDLLDRLRRVGRENGATLYATLLSAYAVLLAIATGADDLLIVSPFAQRDQPELAEAVGLFVNMLMLRVRLGPDTVFRAVVKATGATARAALAHQRVPFRALQAMVQPRTRSTGVAPLLTVFNHVNIPLEKWSIPGVRVTREVIPTETVRAALQLTTTEDKSGLSFQWAYGTELFEASTIAALADRFASIVDIVTQRPDRRLSDLALLVESRRRTYRSPARLERHIDVAHWKRHVAGAPPALQLPSDHPRPPAKASADHRVTSRVWPKERRRSLEAIAHREGCDLGAAIVAAVAALAHRWSGQEDLVLGAAIQRSSAARTPAEPIPVRFRFTPRATFYDALGAVRESCSSATVFGPVAPADLCRALGREPDPSLSPVMQVVVRVLQTPRQAPADILPVAPQASLDLEISAEPTGDDLRIMLSYDGTLFDQRSAEDALDWLEVLADRVCDGPDMPVRSIVLDERAIRSATRVVKPSAAFTPFSSVSGRTLSARFEEISTRWPSRVAVESSAGTVTYRELATRARSVTAALDRATGQGRERVALLFEHDAPMVVGMMGVLASGHAYVPLDPRHPRERLAHLFADSSARVLLTNARNKGLAREVAPSADVLDVDHLEVAPAGYQAQRPPAPSELAYILYTSGSTGGPKGVLQSHENVLYFMERYTENLAIDREDRLTLLSTYTFDAAVMDIFGALLNGAALLPYDLAARGIDELERWIAEARVTIYHSTPTVYRSWVRGLPDGSVLAAVRLVVLGGEEARRSDAEMFRAHFPKGAVLVNGYGPTESTLALQCFLSHESRITGSTLPIGRPIEGTDIDLVDPESGEPALAGEIVIRSEHVALGYWKDPDLTARAFASDSAHAARRTYRSGDFGRLLADGRIEFLGRRDSRVKLRGYRLELSEIESTLLAHPGVSAAAVIVHRADREDARLVAYYCARSGEASLNARALRVFLADRLPAYMVPPTFVALDRLPMTTTGKIDRRALPPPEAETTGDAPLSPLEESVALVWRELLSAPRISASSNFFELGGQSLIAIRLLGRVKDRFGIELSLRSFLLDPTVGAMAAALATMAPLEALAALDDRQLREVWARAIGPAPETVDRALLFDALTRAQIPLSRLERIGQRTDPRSSPLTFSQVYIFRAYEEAQIAFHHCSTVVDFAGHLDLDILRASLREVIRRNESLRGRFRREGERIIQEVSSDAAAPFEVVEIASDGPNEEARARAAIEREMRHPFDLGGPLVRASVFVLSKDRHIMHLLIHHIAFDGSSRAPLLHQLWSLYRSLADGAAQSLPPPRCQLADYADWQRRLIRGPVGLLQREHWRRRLEHAIPTDLAALGRRDVAAASAGSEHNAVFARRTLLPEVERRLAQLGTSESATMLMVLLAALGVSMRRRSRQELLSVFSSFSHRDREETAAIIGDIANPLVISLDMTGRPTYREIIARVRATVVDAFSNPDIPLDILDPDIGAEPIAPPELFRVSLNYTTAPQRRVELGSQLTATSSGRVDTASTAIGLIYRVVKDADGTLVLGCTGSTQWFDEEIVAALVDAFAAALEEMAAAPDQRI